jgi:hypothetical protein
MKKNAMLAGFLDLFADTEDPKEALYDPVHLGGTVIGCLVGIGALYWLLWTLLVFEGGLASKISAALQTLFTSKTLADFGYHGAPHAMGAFEGWIGNVGALGLCLLVVASLHRLYDDAAKKHKKKKVLDR